jgi:hypothetical protein
MTIIVRRGSWAVPTDIYVSISIPLTVFRFYLTELTPLEDNLLKQATKDIEKPWRPEDCETEVGNTKGIQFFFIVSVTVPGASHVGGRERGIGMLPLTRT